MSRGTYVAVSSVVLVAALLSDLQAGGVFLPLIAAIMSDLQTTAAGVGWVINAGTMGCVVSVGLTSALGDRYGHRRVLLVLTAIAICGCVMSALTTSYSLMLVGRFLTGVAVALPLGWGMLRARAKAKQVQTIAIAATAVTATFAPLAAIAGGLLLELDLSWRAGIWLIFVVYIVLFVVTLLSPETPRSERADTPVDWVGALGLGLWATSLLYAISEGPTKGWDSPLVVGALVLGLVVAVGWGYQQRRAAAPIVSLRDMDVRQALVGLSAIVATAMVGAAVTFSIPNMLQSPVDSGWGLGMTAFESTLPSLLILPGTAVAAVIARFALPRFGPRRTLVVAAVAMVLSPLGLALFHSSYWHFWLWAFVYGATVITTMTVSYALLSASCRRDNTAVIFALQNITLFLVASTSIAVILNIIEPDASGIIAESGWITVLSIAAVVPLVFAALWLAFAPRRLEDHHAVDTAPPVAVER